MKRFLLSLYLVASVLLNSFGQSDSSNFSFTSELEQLQFEQYPKGSVFQLLYAIGNATVDAEQVKKLETDFYQQLEVIKAKMNNKKPEKTAKLFYNTFHDETKTQFDL